MSTNYNSYNMSHIEVKEISETVIHDVQAEQREMFIPEIDDKDHDLMPIDEELDAYYEHQDKRHRKMAQHAKLTRVMMK